MKKFLMAIIATILFIVAFFVLIGFTRNIKVVINGIRVEGTKTKIVNDTTMVTVRGVFQAMGFDVDWNADTRTASIYNDSYNVIVAADDEFFYVNDKKIIPATPQIIIDDELYLPLRSIAEAVNCSVDWDLDTYTVYISLDTSIEIPTEVTTAELYSALNSNNSEDFVYGLCENMPKDENFVISPLSIRYAMAMAVNGADGETKQEILNTLSIEDIDAFNSHAKTLMDKYESDKNNDLVFNIANSIWLNTSEAGNIRFSKEFYETLDNYYKAEINEVTDNNAVNEINSWVKDKTNGKIPKIINDAEFMAALVNACYFKANWRYEFSEHATNPDTFTYRNGETAEIDFMHIQEDLKYYADDDIQMVSLPYEGTKNVSMYVILSNDKRMDFTDYYDKCETQLVNVSMPKFKIEFGLEMNEILKAMGINKAFTAQAEFKSMFEDYTDFDNFYISKVLHKAYIDVDEKGTEAAAVTAVLMANGAVAADPVEPVYFKADKPFTYAIRDNENGEILFIGEYACK